MVWVPETTPSNQVNVSLPLPPIAVKFPIPSQAPQVELTVFEEKESVFSACIVKACS